MRYAIIFDLDVEMIRKTYHNDSYNNAWGDIQRELEKFGFIGQQGSVYFGQTDKQDAVQGVLAVQNLSRNYDWFDISVRDIRMLRIEDNNDLKPLLLSNAKTK